jgi:hypothetical protein
MPSTRRGLLTYANVATTLALVVATTGGTLAATHYHYLITSTKQISPKVLKALKGKTGPAGATGEQGEAGSAGEGPAGKEGSPWAVSGTLPSGKTETGTWAFVSNAEGPIRVPLSFPIPTAEPLKPTLGKGPVELLEPKEEDPSHIHPNCPGTVKKPEADPGFICVYSETLEDPLSEPGTVRTSGVVLLFDSKSSAPKTDEGTWAATAP